MKLRTDKPEYQLWEHEDYHQLPELTKAQVVRHELKLWLQALMCRDQKVPHHLPLDA